MPSIKPSAPPFPSHTSFCSTNHPSITMTTSGDKKLESQTQVSSCFSSLLP
jgi:hypothetical protein